MSADLAPSSALAYFNLLQVLYGLTIQRDTGLHHSRGSLLRLAQQRFGVRSRTIAGAVDELRAMKERWLEAEREFREMHGHDGFDCMCFESPDGPTFHQAMMEHVNERLHPTPCECRLCVTARVP